MCEFNRHVPRPILELTWSRMKRAEERGGKHRTTAGSQPLCGEFPERPQPCRAKPLPVVRAQKQLPILEDAVVNQTQHQRRGATDALRQAKENRAAGTAKYLALAAPQILSTQQTAVQPLRDFARDNVVGEQHHWLLQNMQLKCAGQLEQPAAPAAQPCCFRHICSRCSARGESRAGSNQSLLGGMHCQGSSVWGRAQAVCACFQTAKQIHRLCRSGVSFCAGRSSD